jgi:hypothetical protein
MMVGAWPPSTRRIFALCVKVVMRATHVLAQKVFHHLDNKKEPTSLKFSVLVWSECLGILGAVVVEMAVVHARMVSIFPCFSVAGSCGARE